MKFPQYRMLNNGKSFYAVLDEDHYTEVKVWGRYYEKYEFKVRQYNDKLFIYELLNGPDFEHIDQSVYDKEIQRIQLEYTKI